MASRHIADEEFEPDPATWTASEERVFIHLMVNEVDKGNRSSTTFSRKGWKHIELEFHERTNKRYSISQFRNKFNQLRRRYQDFGKLIRQPGFSYNPVVNSVIAPDNVWESYIKVNKNAKRFRRKGFPYYNELGVIFDEPLVEYRDPYPALIHHHHHPKYPCGGGAEEEDKLDTEDASTNDTPSALPSNSTDSDSYRLTSMAYRQHRSPTPTSNFRAAKRSRPGGNGSEAYNWGEGEGEPPMKARSATVTPSMTTAATMSMPDPSSSSSSSAFSITNCVKCLESIEGVDGSTYLKALKMFKDVDWREVFMAMSRERRLVWLGSLE
ncbi:hypothetical protein Dimus_039692 [Dionaea muscipula]